MSIPTDAVVINKTFADHRVAAKVIARYVTPGYVLYAVQKKATEKIDRVTKLADELALALSEQQRRRIHVRISHPPIEIEVARRKPQAIPWPLELENKPHTAAIGRSYVYGNPKTEIVSFDDSPHTLIAGITNSGKSVLEVGMALALASQTSPDDCEFVLVDLKNSALVPLKTLPHVIRFAADEDSALAAVNAVFAEYKRRRDSAGPAPRRLVLIVDELAQLPAEARERIDQLLAVGREYKVNVIAATQHPTAEYIGKRAINYTTRLVGSVTDAVAANVATGRAGTGAQFLPIKSGAFLRIESSGIVRFQSYMLTAEDVIENVQRIIDKWSGAGTHRSAVVTSFGAERAETPQQAGDPLSAVFERYYDGDGGLRRGGIVAAIREEYGDDAQTGGRQYQEQKEAVQEAFRGWVESLPHPFREPS